MKYAHRDKDTDRKCKGEPLSEKTKYNILTQLRGIFTFAYDRDYIEVHPFDKFKMMKLGEIEKKGVIYLDNEQMKQVMSLLDQMVSAKSDQFANSIKYSKLSIEERERRENLRMLEALSKQLFVLFGMFTGARRGEICGLHWSDIDLNYDSEHIHINFKGTQVNIAGKQGEFKPWMKNKSTSRDVFTLNGILGIIKDYKKLQSKVIKEQGWPNTGYVFITMRDGSVNKAGSASKGDTYTHWFSKWCFANRHELGLSDEEAKAIHLHSLRHTYVSFLLNNGVDIATIGESVGHKDLNMDISVYGHIYKKSLINTSDKMEEFFD